MKFELKKKGRDSHGHSNSMDQSPHSIMIITTVSTHRNPLLALTKLPAAKNEVRKKEERLPKFCQGAFFLPEKISTMNFADGFFFPSHI